MFNKNICRLKCDQLGLFINFLFTTGAVAFVSAHYGAGVGRIYYDNVGCIGNEGRLIDCSRGSSVYCSRGHFEDAGVRCQIEGLHCDN